MCKLNELMQVIEQIAPLSLSYKMIEAGSYDNSGIIIESSENANGVLFSLDLTESVVERAKELNCDTIITHHPAIYSPIKSLSINGDTASLLKAIRYNINVVSMHLNLDIAERGIDYFLAQGLGAKDCEIIKLITEKNGYGRVFSVPMTEIETFVQSINNNFGTEKTLFYGNNAVQKVASFCGSGAHSAISAVSNGLDVDTIVTSDLAHHEIKGLIERGKNVVALPHYVSEQYGFNKFFELATEKLQGKAKTFYFIDKRFM